VKNLPYILSFNKSDGYSPETILRDTTGDGGTASAGAFFLYTTSKKLNN
tara:strand:- start:2 stop:148 length:147 start_codon:yes stop_codon:yes gene_type:complete